MAKNYIKLWDSYDSYFEPLGAAEVGRLVLAMMKYKSSGAEPEFSGSEKFIWPAIRRDLDEDAAYTEKKATAGKAGGAPEANRNAGKNKQKQAKTSIPEQKQTGLRTKDVGLRTEDKKEISPSGDIQKSAEAPPPTRSTKKFSPPDIEAVKSYFAEKGGTTSQAERFHAYYESNGWKVGRNPMKNWKAAVVGWISRDKEQKTSASVKKPFMASRPPEEAAAHPNDFMRNAVKRRPLRKNGGEPE